MISSMESVQEYQLDTNESRLMGVGSLIESWMGLCSGYKGGFVSCCQHLSFTADQRLVRLDRVCIALVGLQAHACDREATGVNDRHDYPFTSGSFHLDENHADHVDATIK